MIPLKNPDKKSVKTIFNKSFDPISRKINNLHNYTSPIVYHGTFAEFEKFDKSKIGSSTKTPFAQYGFFFASNPKVALSYASKQIKQQRIIKDKIEKLMNQDFTKIFSNFLNGVYLNKNDEKTLKLMKLLDEYFILDEEEPTLDEHGTVKKYILHFKNPFIIDMEGNPEKEFPENIVPLIKSKGHDGLIIKNTFDAITSTSLFEPTNIYVAFDESQIEEII